MSLASSNCGASLPSGRTIALHVSLGPSQVRKSPSPSAQPTRGSWPHCEGDTRLEASVRKPRPRSDPGPICATWEPVEPWGQSRGRDPHSLVVACVEQRNLHAERIEGGEETLEAGVGRMAHSAPHRGFTWMQRHQRRGINARRGLRCWATSVQRSVCHRRHRSQPLRLLRNGVQQRADLQPRQLQL